MTYLFPVRGILHAGWQQSACSCRRLRIVFGGLGLLENKKATCYPGYERYLTGAHISEAPVVVDGNITTGRSAGHTFDFALELLSQLKGDEVAKEVTRAYLVPATIGVFINLDIYNGFSPEIKKIWDDLCAELQKSSNEGMVEEYYKAAELMKKAGMNFYYLPNDEREKWAELLKPYAEDLLNGLDPAVAADFRKVTEALDAKYPYKAE